MQESENVCCHVSGGLGLEVINHPSIILVKAIYNARPHSRDGETDSTFWREKQQRNCRHCDFTRTRVLNPS